MPDWPARQTAGGSHDEYIMCQWPATTHRRKHLFPLALITMKLSAAIAFLCFALLLLNRVESRFGHHPPGQGHHPPGQGHHHHHHHHRKSSAFFIFGDSFADTGNLPRWDDTWPVLSRQWRYPYAGDGRFSNGMVQSDLIARILGQSEAPPAHALGAHAGRTGMNFAVGGSGVFEVPQEKPTLGMQVDSFLSLVQAGGIKRKHLAHRSVALVAVSGNDYARVGVTGFREITALVEKVTEEIVATVARLQHIGVQKVLVNNLSPLGCAPSESRRTNHTSCDELANEAASLHNRRLADKLAGMDDDSVLVVDLSGAFAGILEHHADGGEAARYFVHKLTPCCESMKPGGYCGQRQEDLGNKMVDMYTVCDDPDEYFYWDDMNPTQAGWAAVMAQLESPIAEFLKME